MPRTIEPQKAQTADPLKEATVVTMKRLVDPLIDLMFDTGVTVHEFNQLVRERAVRTAAKRVSKESGRDSKSRVAIITGLPRSEVARILKSSDVSSSKRLGQQPIRRVLAAWFDNPRFLTSDGEPAVLPIFGKRRSFEQLVAINSGGIPVRAMLDELTQIDAIERLSDQRVKAKSRIPILTGLTDSGISLMGERTRDLLDTLTNNLRRVSNPLFEGTAVVDETDLELVSLMRREIAEQGANFINGVNSLFNRSRVKHARLPIKTSAKCRLGVTVYYFQNDPETASEAAHDAHGGRKNLQRKRRATTKRQSEGSVRRVATKVQV